MASPRSRIWLFPLLILIGLLVQPAGVESQCVTNGSPYIGTFAFPPYKTVRKYLTAPANCVRAMTVNASFCFPATTMPPPGPLVMTLTANANTAMTVSPTCAWTCTCGTAMAPGITIGPSDGLPVELMDFAIED